MTRLRVITRMELLIFAVLLLLVTVTGCGKATSEEDATAQEAQDAFSAIERQIKENIGEPRVEQISEHVWTAIGYDLASTLLVHTNEGNVIVDVSTCPATAREVKQALLEKAPSGPVKAIIYTHSHIDHVGGATVWAEEGTQIWATADFTDHFFKQYQFFLKTETARGRRQFDADVPKEELPAYAIGSSTYVDNLEAMSELGFLVPTNTFSNSQFLVFGGLDIGMYKAPGETHDQLIVWIPGDKTLCPADDFYWAFPNLYTIRGTSPRPIDTWIQSLDVMRRFEAEHLIPMHTKPIHGKAEISQALTTYRDGIQWVRDEVVRRANRGEDIDTIAESVELPSHLAGSPYLVELYGQVDWSARGYYDNSLGWFDGSPDKLYPIDHDEVARREVELMGGPKKVFDLAGEALRSGDPRWAIHLLTKLDDSNLAEDDLAGSLPGKLAESYRRLGVTISNVNGRSYMLESAIEVDEGLPEAPKIKYTEETIAGFPLELIFSNMVVLLDPAKTSDVYKSVRFVFPNENKSFTVTVRYGIAELAEGDPLPGTPEPLAVLTSDAQTYRMVALGMLSSQEAYATGKLTIKGNFMEFMDFMKYFQ